VVRGKWQDKKNLETAALVGSSDALVSGKRLKRKGGRTRGALAVTGGPEETLMGR